MTVIVNGRPRELPTGTSVADLLRLLGTDPGARGVAVALGGEVIPRREWPAIQLTDGSRLEVVAAIGGG